MEGKFQRKIFTDRYYKFVLFFIVTLFVIVYNFSKTENLSRNVLIISANKWNSEQMNLTLARLELPPQGFLVSSNKCHMKDFDCCSGEYMQVYREKIAQQPIDCSNNTDRLVVKEFDVATKSYKLHINKYVIRTLNMSVNDELSCCYRQIIRKENIDYDYTLLECKDFVQDFVVPNEVDGCLVQCKAVHSNVVVYEDAHFFIQERENISARFAPATEENMKFGILLLGIDAVSQFNFRGVMPKTFEKLQKDNWFELRGYNKMDDNTFPNLMAIFTGYDQENAIEICKPKTPDGLNNCTQLFNEFHENGFITAYAEDESSFSTFNYLKKGFQKPPTDYYLRPFVIAIEEKLPIRKFSGMKYCVGFKRSAEYVYDFGFEFANRYLGENIFALLWANSFSHDDFAAPALLDHRFFDYLNELELRKILDHNIIILLSDHGQRWGTLRNMPNGYLEERLPLLFIWLPKKLRQQYPEFVYALTVNKHRLSSPYDLHMTLKHLISLSTTKQKDYVDKFAKYKAKSCPKCQTILKPLPKERNCEDAGITEHWCTCTFYEIVDGKADKMKNLTNLIIDKMNEYINKSSYGELCAPLSYKYGKDAVKKVTDVDGNNVSAKYANDIDIYRIRFAVDPNEAEFESTFTYNKTNHSVELDVETISRLTLYKEDAECCNDKIGKKYCICKTKVNKS